SLWRVLPPPPPLSPYTTLFRSGVHKAFASMNQASQTTIAAKPPISELEPVPEQEPAAAAVPGIDDAPAAIDNDGRLARLPFAFRSEEHTSELQSRFDLLCRLLL